jgi:hypothetical protein
LAVDYCRECCGEIASADYVCRECGADVSARTWSLPSILVFCATVGLLALLLVASPPTSLTEFIFPGLLLGLTLTWTLQRHSRPSPNLASNQSDSDLMPIIISCCMSD